MRAFLVLLLIPLLAGSASANAVAHSAAWRMLGGRGVTSAGAVPEPPASSPPVSSYQWDEGDLDESRVPIVPQNAWADDYDTIAELEALGWLRVDISATDCADNGSGSSTDEAAITSAISTNCSATTDVCDGPSGTDNGVVFVLDDNAGGVCYYDIDSELLVPYSNMAWFGDSKETVVIQLHEGGGFTSPTTPIAARAVFYGDPTGTPNTTDCTWSTGNARNALTVTVPDTCSAAAGDLIRLIGDDTLSGLQTYHHTEVASVALDTPPGSDTITMVDPLPNAFTLDGSSVVRVYNDGAERHLRRVIFKSMTLTYPEMPRGAGTNTSPFEGDGNGIYFWDTNQGLVEDVRFLRRGPFAVRLDGYGQNWVGRHNDHGENWWTARRQNNSKAYNFGAGGGHVVYNEAFGQSSGRAFSAEQNFHEGYFGFSYQASQDPAYDSPAASWDQNGPFDSYTNAGVSVTESGNYHSDNTVSDSQFPCFGGACTGGERFIYLHATSGQGANFLFEGIDSNGNWEWDGQNSYSTTALHLVRMDRQNGTQGRQANLIASESTNTLLGFYVTASRFDDISQGDGYTNSEYELNVYEGTSATDATATLINHENTTGDHSQYETAAVPPSWFFQTNDPPSWWCQEACPWDGSGAMTLSAAGCKLPAQIRYEGGTCTPP